MRCSVQWQGEVERVERRWVKSRRRSVYDEVVDEIDRPWKIAIKSDGEREGAVYT